MDVLASELSKVYPEFALYRSINARIRKIEFAIENRRYWQRAPDEDGIVAHMMELEGMLRQLERNSPIQPIRKKFSRLQKTAEYLNEKFGFSFAEGNRSLDGQERALLETLKEASSHARRIEREQIITLEILEKLGKGFYLIFNTLSVRDEEMKKVFAKKSKPWAKYLRSVDNGIRKQLNQSREKYKRKHNHSYCAVVERGTKGTQRLHIHVLHCVRVLPKGSTDPNYGRNTPDRRQISCMWKYWDSGTSTPKAVRINNGDAYAKMGWRWPVELDDRTKKYLPLRPSSPERAAKYMAKYVNKPDEEKMIWRTRTSRDYGKTIPRRICRKLSTATLEVMGTPTKVCQSLHTGGVKIPERFLRIVALESYLARQKAIIRRKNRWTTTKSPEQWNGLKKFSAEKCRPGLLERLRTQRASKDRKVPQGLKSTTNTWTPTSLHMAISELSEIHAEVSDQYMKDQPFAIGRADV